MFQDLQITIEVFCAGNPVYLPAPIPPTIPTSTLHGMPFTPSTEPIRPIEWIFGLNNVPMPTKETENGAIPDQEAAKDEIINYFWVNYKRITTAKTAHELDLLTTPLERLNEMCTDAVQKENIEKCLKINQGNIDQWFAAKEQHEQLLSDYRQENEGKMAEYLQAKKLYDDYNANPPIDHYEGGYVVIKATSDGMSAVFALGQFTHTPQFSSPSADLTLRRIIEGELLPIVYGFGNSRWNRSAIEIKIAELAKNIPLAFELQRLRDNYQGLIGTAETLRSLGY